MKDAQKAAATSDGTESTASDSDNDSSEVVWSLGSKAGRPFIASTSYGDVLVVWRYEAIGSWLDCWTLFVDANNTPLTWKAFDVAPPVMGSTVTQGRSSKYTNAK